LVGVSSGKICIHGLEYAYIGDLLSFGEETPDYRCTFYAGSFHHLGDAYGNPPALPPFHRAEKTTESPEATVQT